MHPLRVMKHIPCGQGGTTVIFPVMWLSSLRLDSSSKENSIFYYCLAIKEIISYISQPSKIVASANIKISF